MTEPPELEDYDDEYGRDDLPPYRPVEEIEGGLIPAALGQLVLFDETYLRMQAYNLDFGIEESWHSVLRPFGCLDDAVFLPSQVMMCDRKPRDSTNTAFCV